jgi:hypothetical protein
MLFSIMHRESFTGLQAVDSLTSGAAYQRMPRILPNARKAAISTHTQAGIRREDGIRHGIRFLNLDILYPYCCICQCFEVYTSNSKFETLANREAPRTRRKVKKLFKSIISIIGG